MDDKRELARSPTQQWERERGERTTSEAARAGRGEVGEGGGHEATTTMQCGALVRRRRERTFATELQPLSISLTRDNNHHQHKLKHELSKTPRCRTLRSRSSSCCSCCSPTPAAASRPRAQRSTHSGARDKALKFLSHACPKPASRSLALLGTAEAEALPTPHSHSHSLTLSRARDHHHAARDQIRVRGNRTW